jgi:LysR family transcriptional regulator, glycine cleavage system transcriptional activator
VPSFAGRWLMSRLGSFLEANPQYEIAVDANHIPTNFTTDNIDVAVRFGVGPWAGVHSEFLANDTYVLVCSPKFNRGKLPTKPAQLARYNLLLQERDLWERWFALAGVSISPPSTGIDYNDSTIFVQQAINGEGIGLLRRSLVRDAIAAGSLVQLFDITFKSTRGYHLVCLPQTLKSPKIRAFREWLVKNIDWSQE